MRSILLQSRRTSSRAHLFPRLPSSSFSPLRFNFTTSSPDGAIAETPSQNLSRPPLPSLLQPPPAPSPSQLQSSSRAHPPPVDDSSSSRHTTSPPSTERAASREWKPKSIWLSQQSSDRNQEQAITLAARLEAEGSDAVVATPKFVLEVRNLFQKVPRLARASDDHLRALSTICQASSTSQAVLEDARRREWIRNNTCRLLSFFTRRRSLKFESLLPFLRLILHSGPDDLDLTLTRDLFRKLAVGLASGAKDASEAVEIVGELRRLSPSAFTEVEFEELLQAIGRVKDWAATTQDTFQLPSFPAPLPPLPPPPRLTSSPPIKLLTTPALKAKPSSRTTSGETSSPSSPPTEKNPHPPPPPSSSRSNAPPTTQSSAPTSTSPSPAIASSNSSPSISTPISPPSSSNNAQEEELLQFSRDGLSNAPPPSADPLQFVYELFKAAFPHPHNTFNRARIEVAIRILVHASRAPPLPPQDRHRFAGLVWVVLYSVENLPFVEIDSFGPDVRKDLLSLVGRAGNRGQVHSLALFLYKSQRRDFEEEELKDIFDARDRLPVDDRHIRALQIDQDWERGFRTRLGEMMKDASRSSSRPSSNTLNHDTDADWVEHSKQALHREPDPRRGVAYGLLKSRPIQAPSSSESLVVASNLYSRYAQMAKGLPPSWRQHGDAIVRMLLLFSNHQGETPPPFKLLEPVLRHLPLLPPSFIPSTSSFPSFAIPLLPMATNLNESLFIVNSILHAQKLDPTTLPQIWSTFLSSVERDSTPPSLERILDSKLFGLIEALELAESPLEDLVQMFLRRWSRIEVEGSEAKKEDELKELEKLERLVTMREEGNEGTESIRNVLEELRGVLEMVKV